MSLKFGIYLVEQRIISPEQFCGLVKIQQGSMVTLASMAVRTNALTIRQVSAILDVHEQYPDQLFGDIALDTKLLDRAALNTLLHAQQKTCPSMRQLLVECGLLTQRQTRVLFTHFEKNVARQTADAAQANPARPPATPEPVAQPVHGSAPRQPKFNARPATAPQTTNSK